MLARLSAFVIWALVAATAVFWGLRLFVRAPVAPAYAVPVGDTAAVRGDLTRLLGSAPVAAPAAVATPQAASRFKLLGIVAPKYASTTASSSTHGVALIAVDGKMAKAYPVGARVDNDLVLQSVSLRTVSIGPTQGAPTITLELPPLAAAATGTLPINIGGGAGAPLAPSAPVPQYVPPAPPLAVPPPPQAPPVNRPESNAPTQ
ncbi:type II secretion system protein N [Rhizobacter fulvus]|jgi:general secretion pathway protein C